MTTENNNNVSSQQEQYQDMQTTRPDAFSKYSNDVTRLKTLLLKEEDEDFDIDDFSRKHYSTSTVNIKGSVVARSGSLSSNHQQEEVNSSKDYNPQDDDCTCKTRITFEVHPSLILDDIFLELDDPNAEEIDMALDLEILLFIEALDL